MRGGPTLLRAHEGYLRQRAEEVGYSGQILFQELRARGYRGSYETVKLFVRPLRTRASKRRARARAIHWRYDYVMPDYRRAYVPGGPYFFTVNTYRRQTFLTDADVRSALREAIGTLRLTYPFVIEAWVLLPEHMHAL
ncbi:MAG: hypothetical protein M3495_14930 [Pseudomonadota bacterium]|nr:hypothetical protein [Gammaproteobacteria bacterium]MDQ3582811.1 hypothetical protein [Pseudomonadota bacterium]